MRWAHSDASSAAVDKWQLSEPPREFNEIMLDRRCWKEREDDAMLDFLLSLLLVRSAAKDRESSNVAEVGSRSVSDSSSWNVT